MYGLLSQLKVQEKSKDLILKILQSFELLRRIEG